MQQAKESSRSHILVHTKFLMQIGALKEIKRELAARRNALLKTLVAEMERATFEELAATRPAENGGSMLEATDLSHSPARELILHPPSSRRGADAQLQGSRLCPTDTVLYGLQEQTGRRRRRSLPPLKVSCMLSSAKLCCNSVSPLSPCPLTGITAARRAPVTPRYAANGTADSSSRQPSISGTEWR